MKAIKQTISVLLLSFVMVGFSQCSSANKLQEKPPIEIGEVYFVKWVSGVRGGGHGINIFIPVKDTEVMLDSVYFRERVAKLNINPSNNKEYIGSFIEQSKEPTHDIIISSDSLAESNNKLVIIEPKSPFTLEHNECVVSYKEGEKTKYFKIKNIKEKKTKDFPMSPRN